MTMNDVMGYLAMHGIPKKTIREIRMVLAADAVKEAEHIHMDRIFSGVALMLHNTFGFGAKRIVKGLHDLDAVYLSITEGGEWMELMTKLKDETGVIIRSGEERFVVECLTDEERKNYKYGEDNKL